MPLINMAALRAGLPPGQRLLGLDLGARVIGLALSDVLLMLASPYPAIRRAKLRRNATELAAIAARQGVGGLVVGWPLSMDGSLGPAAESARDWASALSEAIGLPCALWDERLSSAAINRAMIREADLTRQKRAAAVDSAAASYILQAALDATGGATLHPAPPA
jgi:putative Holliday junction resolvase